jgi:gluconolactonase
MKNIALAVVALLSQDNTPIPGIGPAGDIVKVHTGFKFTEGPAVDAEGAIYFTDIPNNRIHKIGLDGSLTTVLENSEACNGLMVDAKGLLIACQGGTGRVISIDPATKKISVVADTLGGKIKKPNDLVVDARGGVYFTDPDEKSVYYAAAGQATCVISDLPRPNGVLLSPDEKTLIVLPSGSPDVMVYPVQAPGKLGPARKLATLEQAPGGRVRGGDGLTVDTKGNLYLTQPSLSAIQVVTPEGKTLGLLKFPEGPSNCTFGGKDMKTLYVTARTSVYAVKMEATGHRFPGGTR